MKSKYYAQSYIHNNQEATQESNTGGGYKMYLDELILKDRNFFTRMINAKKDMEILRKGVERSITPEIIVQEEVMVS